MMFQPRLSLVLGKGGTYTLLASTLVPNTCYVASGSAHGWPAGMAGIPEYVPVQLMIDLRGGICLHQVRDVHHMHEGIDLGDGRSAVVAFVVVDGKVMGRGRIEPPEAAAMKGLADAPPLGVSVIPQSVHAWADRMPIGPASFHVIAQVVTPTPGYGLDLQPASPQGINPQILILDLAVTPPSGSVIQVPTVEPVAYRIDDYDGDYSQVTVRNGTQAVTVAVQDVH